MAQLSADPNWKDDAEKDQTWYLRFDEDELKAIEAKLKTDDQYLNRIITEAIWVLRRTQQEEKNREYMRQMQLAQDPSLGKFGAVGAMRVV